MVNPFLYGGPGRLASFDRDDSLFFLLDYQTFFFLFFFLCFRRFIRAKSIGSTCPRVWTACPPSPHTNKLSRIRYYTIYGSVGHCSASRGKTSLRAKNNRTCCGRTRTTRKCRPVPLDRIIMENRGKISRAASRYCRIREEQQVTPITDKR